MNHSLKATQAYIHIPVHFTEIRVRFARDKNKERETDSKIPIHSFFVVLLEWGKCGKMWEKCQKCRFPSRLHMLEYLDTISLQRAALLLSAGQQLISRIKGGGENAERIPLKNKSCLQSQVCLIMASSWIRFHYDPVKLHQLICRRGAET